MRAALPLLLLCACRYEYRDSDTDAGTSSPEAVIPDVGCYRLVIDRAPVQTLPDTCFQNHQPRQPAADVPGEVSWCIRQEGEARQLDVGSFHAVLGDAEPIVLTELLPESEGRFAKYGLTVRFTSADPPVAGTIRLEAAPTITTPKPGCTAVLSFASK